MDHGFLPFSHVIVRQVKIFHVPLISKYKKYVRRMGSEDPTME